MFAALFGKSKKKEEAVHPPPKSKVMETTAMLMQKEDDLEKRNAMLAAKSRVAAQEAIELNKANKKQQALVALNKHKMYEKEIETNNAMLLKLMMQRTAAETTNMNTETFNVMQQANEVIKSQQKQWTPEKVAELTDEMHELLGNQVEITDMISAPIGNGLVTEIDLEAELAALEQPMAEPSVLAMPPIVPNSALQSERHTALAPAEAAAVASLPEFPAVPMHTPKAAVHTPKAAVHTPSVATTDMDRELAALAAMM
jgi:hypothetical protein